MGRRGLVRDGEDKLLMSPNSRRITSLTDHPIGVLAIVSWDAVDTIVFVGALTHTATHAAADVRADTDGVSYFNVFDVVPDARYLPYNLVAPCTLR